MDNSIQTTQLIAPDVKLGKDVRIFAFVNLYGCEIGDNSKIGAFVEIQKNARIGKNVKVSSHTFICEGVTIEDDVFIGHNVSFINDKYPRSTAPSGALQTESDWKVVPTLVGRGASIGTSSTILCGVTIGENAIIGAGSVVTKNIPANVVAAGHPARVLRALG
jgi:acetyltransferase-like isoleucine patch superfamily enzyme